MRRPAGYALIVLAAGCLAAGAARAQDAADTLRVEARIHPAVVKVGERVHVRIAVPALDPSTALIGPTAPASFGDADVVASAPAPAGPDSTAWSVEVALFSPGNRDLTDIPFTLRTPAGDRPVRLLPYSLSVENSLPADADTLDIRDIAPPVAVPARWRYGRVAGVLAVLLAAAAGLWWYRRRPRPVPVPALPYQTAVPADRQALAALRELEREALPARGMVQEHFFRLSMILRIYMERRFAVPAVESTTDEIRGHLQGRPAPSPELAAAGTAILEEADLVKFARHDPGPEAPSRAVSRAREWVERTTSLLFPEPAAPPSGASEGDGTDGEGRS